MQIDYKAEYRDYLMRPSGSKEIRILVYPLAKLSKSLNRWLGVHDDEDALKQRPPWQRAIAIRLQRRKWVMDLRQWAEVPALAWLATMLLVFYATLRLAAGHLASCAISTVCVACVSVLISVVALTRSKP